MFFLISESILIRISYRKNYFFIKQTGIRVQGGYQRDWKGHILLELRL